MGINDILTPAKLAEKLGVTERVILDWREMGMPWVKIGKNIYILEKSFISWMKSREIGKTPKTPQEKTFWEKE